MTFLVVNYNLYPLFDEFKEKNLNLFYTSHDFFSINIIFISISEEFEHFTMLVINEINFIDIFNKILLIS